LTIAAWLAILIGISVLAAMHRRAVKRLESKFDSLLKELSEVKSQMVKFDSLFDSSRRKARPRMLADRILELRSRGLSYNQIARELGVTKQLVHYYLKKRR